MLLAERFDLRTALKRRKLIGQHRAFIVRTTMSNDHSLSIAFVGLDHYDLATVSFLTNYRGQFVQQQLSRGNSFGQSKRRSAGTRTNT